MFCQQGWSNNRAISLLLPPLENLRLSLYLMKQLCRCIWYIRSDFPVVRVWSCLCSGGLYTELQCVCTVYRLIHVHNAFFPLDTAINAMLWMLWYSLAVLRLLYFWQFDRSWRSAVLRLGLRHTTWSVMFLLLTNSTKSTQLKVIRNNYLTCSFGSASKK